eukprot:scaffold144623_cov33-Tisochrysis_lutea.AAC.2
MQRKHARLSSDRKRTQESPSAACHTAVRLGDETLDLVVADEDEGAAKSAQHVGAEALEHGTNALRLDDLRGAVQGALIEPLVAWLLGLHLKATANGVEGVRNEASNDGSGLGDGELGQEPHDTLVVLERVDGLERVEDAEVRAAIRDDANHRDAKTAVHGEDTAIGGGLHEAVDKAVELRLARANIRCKAGTCIVKRIDNGERAGAGEAAGGNVGKEELGEVSLRVVFGEKCLDRVLEREVEGLGREVPDDVDGVATPARVARTCRCKQMREDGQHEEWRQRDRVT